MIKSNFRPDTFPHDSGEPTASPMSAPAHQHSPHRPASAYELSPPNIQSTEDLHRDQGNESNQSRESVCHNPEHPLSSSREIDLLQV